MLGIIAPCQKNEGLPEFVAFKMVEINERYKKSEHTGGQELCVDDRLWSATNDVNANVYGDQFQAVRASVPIVLSRCTIYQTVK